MRIPVDLTAADFKKTQLVFVVNQRNFRFRIDIQFGEITYDGAHPQHNYKSSISYYPNEKELNAYHYDSNSQTAIITFCEKIGLPIRILNFENGTVII